MSTITYVNHDGQTRSIDASDGISVMQAALSNGISGIEADCGGAASCATCHVYVDQKWAELVGGPGEDENDMLDCTASERRANSRLSCQIEISSKLDGLVVYLPESQS